MTQPKLRIDDVDDVVGLAAEMMQEEQEMLDADDLHQVGRELDIPPEYIERARTELKRRRAEDTKALETRDAKRRRQLKIGGISTAGVALVSLLWGWSSISSLRHDHAAVAASRAQVDNVRARKHAVEAQLAERPDSVDKDAELIGAENRVRVETQRYAREAAHYNDAAARFPASWLAPMADLPSDVPLSLD